jgi:hypothetical protein
MMLAALGAATMAFAVPAAAQDVPLVGGNYWDVAGITVDDGQLPQYADYLAGQYRKNMEFQKSKGWVKDFIILSNVNQRKDEPDLYLITIMDHVPNAAEQVAREKEMTAFLQQTTRQLSAGSGQRATYRHLGSNMLLQEMRYR